APPNVETPVGGVRPGAVLVGVEPLFAAAVEVAGGLVMLPGVPLAVEVVLPPKVEPGGTPRSGSPRLPPLRGAGTRTGISGGRGWLTFTTMSPNSSGVRRRPTVLIGSVNDCPGRTGGAPTVPTAASRFWLRIAAATSSAVMFFAASACGFSHARTL